MLDDHALWRDNFVGALQLLALAAARLPFGIPDPILCGASAVTLYTGDLWPVDELRVIAADTRPLTAELFAVGFRWTQRPLYLGEGLWHPQLRIGADVIEDHVSLASAEFLNVLSVTGDWPLAARLGGELASIKVIGIEDLIVEQATEWLARRMPTSEVATKSGVLVNLAQSGVGGRFRGAYLQRRLAWETNGEVAFDASPFRDDLAEGSAPRMTTLTRMQTLINAWHLRHGFAFDAASSRTARGSRRNRTLENRYQYDEARRAGTSSFESANVVPFDV
jgi:hypothetical protein